MFGELGSQMWWMTLANLGLQAAGVPKESVSDYSRLLMIARDLCLTPKDAVDALTGNNPRIRSYIDAQVEKIDRLMRSTPSEVA